MSSYRSPRSSPWRRKRLRTNSLPLDLLHNVLSRLPTTLLLKLRYVCREWRDIINDPHFAAMHVKSGVENPRILLLSKPSRGADPRFTVSDELLVTSLPKSAVTAWSHGVGASCHGLLCFDDLLHGGTYLLNPLTQEIVSLSSVGPCKRWHQHRIAIGVDHLTSRYKILRMSSFIGKDRKICSMRAEVLDQGSRSWRDIASVPPCLLLGKPVFTAGSIHLIVTGAGVRVPRILSFDLAKEEFARTPSPEFCEASLVDLRGVLGLVDSSHEESHDVWVMEESGVWAKK
ncbi:F-box protein At3g07870-like [Syzygium oleosum]|uniref:F-box protein At3g07870-like n=1 Tax=Syzygium oleosum TaxID=219896 RepID=UPI0024B8C800|nr:F-box protein At3g07870-like [Syzygium oleosum]